MKSSQSIVSFSALAAAAVLCLWVAGCDSNKSSSTQPADIRARQDAALRDPFGYKMKFDESVSGGGTMDLKQDQLNRDVKNVLNP